jgi:hypothetical protein
MFANEAEGRAQLAKDEAFRKQAAFEASPVGYPITQGLATINRAINTATGNLPEIAANMFGQTTRPITESDAARSIGEGIGFVAPTGAPMRAIKAMEGINNPLTRNVAQGAAAMATQLPTDDRGTGEYLGGVALGGASGVAGRGLEKVASGAIQQGAKATAGRIHDYLVKLPVGAFKFGKNPIKVAADEGIIANNMAEYEQKAAQLLKERSAQLEGAIQGSNKTVDISEMVDKHLNQASGSLGNSLKDRTSAIAELNTVKERLVAQYGDLKAVPVQDAIKLKRQLGDDFPFVRENADDPATKAAHKIYHDINVAVEQAHPEIAQLNERVSGLIDIKNAARNRGAVENRNHPFGLVARLGGMAGIVGGSFAHNPEAVITGLTVLGIEKAIQSPAVLTRVAKALSAMSMEDRLKVVTQFPKLKTVIKVDARDVEIITPQPKSTPIAMAVPRAETADVVPHPPQGQIAGTPIRSIGYNRSAEGQGRPQPQPYAGNEYGVTGKKINKKQLNITSSGAENPAINMPQSIDDLERYIQSRYEAGASQNELDMLETFHSEQIARAEKGLSLQKVPQIVESIKSKTKSLPTEDILDARSKAIQNNPESKPAGQEGVSSNPRRGTPIPSGKGRGNSRTAASESESKLEDNVYGNSYDHQLSPVVEGRTLNNDERGRIQRISDEIKIARSKRADSAERQNRGFIDTRGIDVSTPSKLLEVANNFNNPAVEELQFIGVDKAGKVVFHQVGTANSGSHASSKFVDNRSSGRSLLKIKSALDRTGADGVYVVHNHPSNVADFSLGDEKFMRHLNQLESAGFNVKGYGVIGEKGNTFSTKVKKDGWTGWAKEHVDYPKSSLKGREDFEKDIRLIGEGNSVAIFYDGDGKILGVKKYNSEQSFVNQISSDLRAHRNSDYILYDDNRIIKDYRSVNVPQGSILNSQGLSANIGNINPASIFKNKRIQSVAGMTVGSTLIPRKAEAASSEVDMNKIYSIESSNNPQAHNKSSNAKGLGQITPIVLKEWNNFHPKDKHSDADLFNADTNKKIASWYMNKRIPQMLKAKKLKDTPENRLVAYNAGISKVGKILPRETQQYLKKYKQQKAS